MLDWRATAERFYSRAPQAEWDAEGTPTRGRTEAAVFPPSDGTRLWPFLGAAAAASSGCLEIFVVKQEWGQAVCTSVCANHTHTSLMCVCSKHPVAEEKHKSENFNSSL